MRCPENLGEEVLNLFSKVLGGADIAVEQTLSWPGRSNGRFCMWECDILAGELLQWVQNSGHAPGDPVVTAGRVRCTGEKKSLEGQMSQVLSGCFSSEASGCLWSIARYVFPDS